MNARLRLLFVSFFVALGPSITPLAAADAEWPQFRGPLALGTADNVDLPDTWSATDNVLWKHEIAGRGWSSPIVWRYVSYDCTKPAGVSPFAIVPPTSGP